MVLENIRRRYHGIGHSIKLLSTSAREKIKRTKLHAAKMLGSDEARKKLEMIDTFKRQFGVERVDPRIYDYRKYHLENILSVWSGYLRTLKDMETKLQERGIKLDSEQHNILKILQKEAIRNPEVAERIIITAKYLHSNRGTVAWAAPLKNLELNSKWGRYIGWKLLGPFRPADIEEFVSGYNKARKGKLPLWAAGKYFAFYGQSGKPNEMYTKIVDLIEGERFAPKTFHPALHVMDADPKRAAKLAELFAAMGEVAKDHNNLREVIRDGYKAHRGEEDYREMLALHHLVREEMVRRFGESVNDIHLLGEYHERVKKVQDLKKVWKEILDKHLKPIREEWSKPDLSEDKREELERKYSEALQNAAKEFVDYLEGDEMIRRWISRIKKKIRPKEEGVPKPKEGKPINESIELTGPKTLKKMPGISETEILLAEDIKKEKEQKEREIQAYNAAAEALAPEIDAAVYGPLDVHLKDHLTRVIEETYSMLPLSLKDKAAMIRIDDLYRELFNELKANGIRTNALRINDPEMLDEINKELKAAIIAHVYGKKPEMPKNETIAKILRDIESKKSAINEWQERLAAAKTHEQEYHEKRMVVAERIAEMLAEHVYANPNMKKEIMKRIQEAAERNEVSKYLETFIKNALERVGKKTARGTDKNVFEASLKRMMKELRAHESNVRAARIEAKRAELAMRNLIRDMQKAHQNLEAERRKLAEQQEEILRQYHKELAKELAKILLERADKNHIKFTTISRK